MLKWHRHCARSYVIYYSQNGCTVTILYCGRSISCIVLHLYVSSSYGSVVSAVDCHILYSNLKHVIGLWGKVARQKFLLLQKVSRPPSKLVCQAHREGSAPFLKMFLCLHYAIVTIARQMLTFPFVALYLWYAVASSMRQCLEATKHKTPTGNELWPFFRPNITVSMLHVGFSVIIIH